MWGLKMGTKTIYIITSGIYDDYHIETVTDSKEAADMLDEMYIGSAEGWKIESLEDVKIKYDKWKEMRKDAED